LAAEAKILYLKATSVQLELRKDWSRATHLMNMHRYGILMHMRTTVILNEELLKKAQELSGLREKTAVLHAGLQALISRESAKRLAALGGTEPSLKPIPRRRSRQAK
jgi:Arc/MetJ family transcription regulator